MVVATKVWQDEKTEKKNKNTRYTNSVLQLMKYTKKATLRLLLVAAWTPAPTSPLKFATLRAHQRLGVAVRHTRGEPEVLMSLPGVTTPLQQHSLGACGGSQSQLIESDHFSSCNMNQPLKHLIKISLKKGFWLECSELRPLIKTACFHKENLNKDSSLLWTFYKQQNENINSNLNNLTRHLCQKYNFKKQKNGN